MRDLLPQEMTRFRRVEAAFREVCEGWGYQEVRTPTIEHLWLFTAAGTFSPQMLGRIYSFLDWDGWSGERVVLRPDATIGVARLYVEHLSKMDVAKLYYVQNIFRFAEGEESREDWQCGAELVGDTHPQGDIELLLMGRELLERLGLGPIQVRLSHPGIVRAVLARAGFDAAQQIDLYDRILDGDLTALREIQKRLPPLGGALELLLGTEGDGTAYLANVRSVFLKAIPELARPIDELAAIAGALEGLGCRPIIAAALVRDFEYYTGPAFHFSLGGEKVGGGGRYDSLISLVGGRQVPASGFALDAGKLAAMLADGEEAVARAAVRVRPAGAGTEALADAFRAASALREQGWPAQVAGANSRAGGGWQLTVEGERYTLVKAGQRRGRRFDSLKAVAAALKAGGRA
jgi:histidyl-tRNA synthetase